jgi:hypothetical protein
VKCFCNAKNAILNIQDIEIINTFRDGAGDIKTVEEIATKKPKMVTDLLAVADIWIYVSKAWARLLDSYNKGLPKKKQHEDPIDHGNRKQQLVEQKEMRPFRWLADAEKLCKKILEKLVVQEPWWEKYWRADPGNDDQLDEINVIFGGTMSISSKTQGKKLERVISLAPRIEPGRRIKWFYIDISFRPKDHPKTELSNRNLPFLVKLSIGRHKVAKALVDNGTSLNLIMRKTFIEMGLNLSDLTLVHDTFHGVILR